MVRAYLTQSYSFFCFDRLRFLIQFQADRKSHFRLYFDLSARSDSSPVIFFDLTLHQSNVYRNGKQIHIEPGQGETLFHVRLSIATLIKVPKNTRISFLCFSVLCLTSISGRTKARLDLTLNSQDRSTFKLHEKNIGPTNVSWRPSSPFTPISDLILFDGRRRSGDIASRRRFQRRCFCTLTVDVRLILRASVTRQKLT
jgi:hypothetical protein